MKPPITILCGGKGTRLGDLTKAIPKPMVDVCGKPFLYWLLLHYSKQGFTDITISTGYLADIIENYDWPVKVTFCRDTAVIDPAWIYQNSRHEWVVNGDTWIEKPLPEVDQPTILTYCGIDAGAQFCDRGKIQTLEPYFFYDIGTPAGLAEFTKYLKDRL